MTDGRRLFVRAAGISCDHCRRAIEEAVGAVDGVDAVAVDVDAGTVDVRLATSDAEAAARKAIEDAGYPISEELTGR